MEKYAVITQDKEFVKESFTSGREKEERCKCGGKIDTTSNVLLCSKNGSKCFEK